MKQFEAGFLIGAATAAHQVEGNNLHSDFWAQEHMKNTDFVEPSMDAVDHFNRYQEDITILAATLAISVLLPRKRLRKKW